ncbi:MAG: hypothetical protein VW683_00375 [Betaproteobacteria bacterium]|jgi:hypothetical protein
MGYLNNATVTVDAVLTKKGRERLSQGRGAFTITKFAVADDEIDYTLYNTSHPLGSSYYGSLIENMPILEAIPDETQTMRYKLVTLPRNTNQVPVISIGRSSIELTYSVDSGEVVTPATTAGGQQSFDLSTFGYTAVLYDGEAANLIVTVGVQGGGGTPTLPPGTLTSTAVTKVGNAFQIVPKNVSARRETKLTIFGNESGATVTIPIIINPQPV